MRTRQVVALIGALLLSLDALAAQYGRTTQGASWTTVEQRYQGRLITLSGTETAVKISAYMRSVGTATGGCKAALYLDSDESKAYESSELSGFTDTSGGWKDFTFTSSVAAGSYRLMLICDAVAGGGNTVEVASDTVSSSPTTLFTYAWGIVGGESWPTIAADLTGADDGIYTRDVSIYLETAAAGGTGIIIKRRAH